MLNQLLLRQPFCVAAPIGLPVLARKITPAQNLFCISGHVNSPCNVEEEMGIPLRELLRKACWWCARWLG